jgi:hypothetical protein
MTRDEMNQQLAELDKTYKEAKNKIHAEYAKSERKFDIGDVIEGNGVIIKITSFGWGKFLDDPYPIYKGDSVTKKLEPVKRGNPTGAIHGNSAKLFKDGSNKDKTGK